MKDSGGGGRLWRNSNIMILAIIRTLLRVCLWLCCENTCSLLFSIITLQRMDLQPSSHWLAAPITVLWLWSLSGPALVGSCSSKNKTLSKKTFCHREDSKYVDYHCDRGTPSLSTVSTRQGGGDNRGVSCSTRTPPLPPTPPPVAQVRLQLQRLQMYAGEWEIKVRELTSRR